MKIRRDIKLTLICQANPIRILLWVHVSLNSASLDYLVGWGTMKVTRPAVGPNKPIVQWKRGLLPWG